MVWRSITLVDGVFQNKSSEIVILSPTQSKKDGIAVKSFELIPTKAQNTYITTLSGAEPHFGVSDKVGVLDGSSGTGGTNDHSTLINRFAMNQHDINSITGLQDELTNINNSINIFTADIEEIKNINTQQNLDISAEVQARINADNNIISDFNLFKNYSSRWYLKTGIVSSTYTANVQRKLTISGDVELFPVIAQDFELVSGSLLCKKSGRIQILRIVNFSTDLDNQNIFTYSIKKNNIEDLTQLQLFKGDIRNFRLSFEVNVNAGDIVDLWGKTSRNQTLTTSNIIHTVYYI